MINARTAALALLVIPAVASARGVTPYLPLNLEPEIERQIERVMILADKPVMSRPIAAAAVLEALPKACKVDPVLCRRVASYLSRYTHETAVTHASVEAAATSGEDTTLANRYGLHDRSAWEVSAQAYIQPSDYVLLGLGGVAYDGQQNLTGTMLSVGFDWAQLDVGFRPHWFSPLSDSSMLMSTEAPTMPSATLSNYEPLTRLGLHYELFAARMSKSNDIAFEGGVTSGNPHLSGVHLDMEPVSGWSLGLNRLVQYGGGALDMNGLKDLLKSYFGTIGNDTQGKNQEASITTSLLFPGRTPFAVYAEYAGEDTSRGKAYLLGNAALSVGIHFPRLWRRFDLTVEASEWQNSWYTHTTYLDGLTNKGLVIGSWFGDQRVFGDSVGGNSYMVRLGWDATFGGLLQLQYRTLQNQLYSGYDYQRVQDLSLTYSRPWREYTVGASVEGGQDYFHRNFSRVSGFLRLNDTGSGVAAALGDLEDTDGQYVEESAEKPAHIFVEAGVNEYRVRTDLNTVATRTTGPNQSTAHLAVGVRRAVSDHSDLGTRLEFDDIDSHSLLGVRLVDYRYRFDGPLAISAFLGAERYALVTPAYGFYYGAGLQWRNVLPRCDLGVEFRYSDSIARDHLLPTDPPNDGPRNDSFYDVTSTLLTVSYRF